MASTRASSPVNSCPVSHGTGLSGVTHSAFSPVHAIREACSFRRFDARDKSRGKLPNRKSAVESTRVDGAGGKYSHELRTLLPWKVPVFTPRVRHPVVRKLSAWQAPPWKSDSHHQCNVLLTSTEPSVLPRATDSPARETAARSQQLRLTWRPHLKRHVVPHVKPHMKDDTKPPFSLGELLHTSRPASPIRHSHLPRRGRHAWGKRPRSGCRVWGRGRVPALTRLVPHQHSTQS